MHLSAGDIAALERASTALLSPFAFESASAWRRAACRAVEACVGGDGSSFALPIAGEPLIAASADIERALHALFPPPAWIVEALTVRRRALSLSVADWDELFDVNVVRRAPFYHDVVRPHHLMAPLVMLAETGEDPLPAAVSVYFADERSAAIAAPRRKQLLRLLYPAFRAGLDVYLSFRHNAAALTALVEDAGIGVVIFEPPDLRARENEFFGQLMSCEPERDRVRVEVIRAVRGASNLRRPSGSSSRSRPTNTEVRTACARYRLSATFLSGHGSRESVLATVLVERLGDRPLTGRELGARFLLTRREIETAMLVRHGLPTRQIAIELGVSLNTARRHVEKILFKLDVTNRTAAAAKISGQ
jgi:DNA-binding CsgD family transcriptional regulator